MPKTVTSNRTFPFQKYLHSLSDKLRIVYLPFILIDIGFLVGYSFLNWLLLIKMELFALNEDLVNFWLPFGLPWLAILIWLRPRVKALRLIKLGRSNLRELFCMVSGFAVFVPTMLGQEYLATATGKMTHLEQIGQIQQVPKTKYYTVQDAFFDKTDASVETSGQYFGRYNSGFEMDVYFTCPIEDYGDTHGGNVWLGTVYKSQISGHLSDDERESQFHDFFNSSSAAYNKLDLKNFSYLEKLGPSNDDKEFEAAVKRSKLYHPGKPNIVLEAHADNFTDRNGNKLEWVFGSFGIGAVVCFLILLAAPIDKKEMSHVLSEEKQKDDVAHRRSDKKDQDALQFARMVFLPNRVAFVTPLLIDINIAVFVWMVLAGVGFVSFDSNDLLAWGGNFKPAVMNGESWRLATSMFVHGGLMHLIGNLFMLFLVGLMLEAKIGHILFFYLLFHLWNSRKRCQRSDAPGDSQRRCLRSHHGSVGCLDKYNISRRRKEPESKERCDQNGAFYCGIQLVRRLVNGRCRQRCPFGRLALRFVFGCFVRRFP